MHEADVVRNLAKKGKQIAEQKRIADERKEKRERNRIRKEALGKVGEFVERCVKAAKEHVLLLPDSREVKIKIADIGTNARRSAYGEAVDKVIKILKKKRFSATAETWDFKGHINSDEVEEEYHDLYIRLGW